MKKEVIKHLRVKAPGDGTFSAEFCFPASFRGFDGHFPEQPVLPGVCLIQAVLVAAEQALAKKLELEEIVLAKFIAVTLPDEKLSAACSISGDGMVRANVVRGEDRIAEIRLRVRDA
jgi:3-hydroxyacyl-[acyl-carrier-protein] dehydratase